MNLIIIFNQLILNSDIVAFIMQCQFFYRYTELLFYTFKTVKLVLSSKFSMYFLCIFFFSYFVFWCQLPSRSCDYPAEAVKQYEAIGGLTNSSSILGYALSLYREGSFQKCFEGDL